MGKGRKPTPETVRQRQSEHRMACRTGLLSGPIMPDRPHWLSVIAAAEWDRVVPDLAAQGILAQIDSMMLASYCQTYATWRECEETVRREGLMIEDPSGRQRVHPLARHAQTVLSELRRIAAEFGFSPASRSRILLPPGEEGDDEFTKWLRGDNGDQPGDGRPGQDEE